LSHLPALSCHPTKQELHTLFDAKAQLGIVLITNPKSAKNRIILIANVLTILILICNLSLLFRFKLKTFKGTFFP